MNSGNRFSKPLQLALVFVLTASSASARSEKTAVELSHPVGTPEVSIVKVTKLAGAGADLRLTIRVEWSARVPQITELLGFIALAEVEYADGSKTSGSASVGGSARQADVRVPNRGGAQPRKFTASITTDFKIFEADFVTRTQEFVLEKSNGHESNGGSSNARPTSEVAINRVRAKLDDCAAKNDCFIIDWSAGPTPSVTFNQFNIQAEITYVTAAGDVHRNASSSFPSNVRSAQFAVNDVTGVTINRIVVKATIKASATIQKKSLAELKGNF